MEVDIYMPHLHPQMNVYSNIWIASNVDQIIMQAEYQFMNYVIDQKTMFQMIHPLYNGKNET